MVCRVQYGKMWCGVVWCGVMECGEGAVTKWQRPGCLAYGSCIPGALCVRAHAACSVLHTRDGAGVVPSYGGLSSGPPLGLPAAPPAGGVWWGGVSWGEVGFVPHAVPCYVVA